MDEEIHVKAPSKTCRFPRSDDATRRAVHHGRGGVHCGRRAASQAAAGDFARIHTFAASRKALHRLRSFFFCCV